MNQDSYWGGFFVGVFFVIIIMAVVFGGTKAFKDQERLEYLNNEGKCIINDNVKWTIQHYAGKLDNGKIICKTDTGELRLLRDDLE